MKKVIVTPLYGIGDTLMLTPILKVLKEAKPEIELVVATMSKPSTDLLEPLPFIDKVLFLPNLLKKPALGLLDTMKETTFQYDTSITFYPANRYSYNLFALLTGARNRYGHRYVHSNFSQMNWLKNRTVQENEELHCVEENMALLPLMGVDTTNITTPPMDIGLSREEVAYGEGFLAGFNGFQYNVGIHAGTSTFKGHENRRWPMERFIEFINATPNVHFFLFGTGSEVELNHTIKEKINNSEQVTVVEGKSIRQTASIINALDAFVSNDSGLMHLAASVQTKVVAIIGPTSYNFIYPWGVEHKKVSLDLPCSPCFYYSPKPLQCHIDEKFACLQHIPVEKVKEALLELFQK